MAENMDKEALQAAKEAEKAAKKAEEAKKLAELHAEMVAKGHTVLSN